MSLTIGGKTLQIFVTADLKKFNSGLNQAQTGLKGFAGTTKSMVGPALIATAAAAGALAIKLGVDGVKAAIADEAALNKLATTLGNVGLAHDQPQIEEFISGLERSLGIADDELRPAYDRLVRSTGDTALANEALSLALDVSAGSGKSLDSVVQALGRGYDGNTQGLSRLGAGIDKATLATGDMDLISKSLASTFAGQATTSAETLEGQIGRVTLGFDNLKEAFGRGFLNALGETNTATGDLVDTMAELEPVLEDAGTFAVNFALGVKKLADQLAQLAPESDKSESSLSTLLRVSTDINRVLLPFTGLVYDAIGAIADLGDESEITTRSMGRQYTTTLNLAKANAALAGGGKALADTVYDSGIAAAKTADHAERMTEIFSRTGRVWGELTPIIDDNTTASGGSSAATQELTKKQQKLIDVNEALGVRFAATNADLDLQKTKLEAAAQSVTAYANNIQKNLLGGIDLEAAFTGQFDKLGNATGVSLLEGFNKQIDQANAFGDVLQKIRDAKGDAEFINAIASLGPVTGTALATQLIDDGLVPTMSDKYAEVRKSTALLAMSVVPDYMLAGIAAGEATVNGLATQLSKEGERLAKIGKQIAKPVGAAFKAKLEQDVAAALREAEAFGTAARAEVSARESQRQLGITQQQVALALANIVRQADSRSGAVVQPVLA